jgi:hypothetical protein
MGKTTFIILLFISSTSFGQNTRFDTFVKLFPRTVLPTTVKYSESEFKTEYYTPENTTTKKDSIPYRDHILPKDSSLLINYNLVKLFLLADTEAVTPLYPDKLSDTIYPTYYASCRLAIDKNFECLIFERQFNTSAGNPFAEKYLCTLSKTGQLIDKILLASANYSGNGILSEGFRVPWFPDTQSDISETLSIHFKDENHGDFIYQIDDKGKIKKAKH